MIFKKVKPNYVSVHMEKDVLENIEDTKKLIAIFLADEEVIDVFVVREIRTNDIRYGIEIKCRSRSHMFIVHDEKNCFKNRSIPSYFSKIKYCKTLAKQLNIGKKRAPSVRCYG